jgi:hypothetical protein
MPRVECSRRLLYHSTHPSVAYSSRALVVAACQPRPLSEDVDDEGDVDETGPAAQIGEVGDPDKVGRLGDEIPDEQISGPAAADSRHGGADFLTLLPGPVVRAAIWQPCPRRTRQIDSTACPAAC